MGKSAVGLAGVVCAAGLVVGTATPAAAATNTQNGLVNVNVQKLNLQAPVSVAVPVAVAANVCNISALSVLTAGNCNAKSTSTALTYAIAHALSGATGSESAYLTLATAFTPASIRRPRGPQSVHPAAARDDTGPRAVAGYPRFLSGDTRVLSARLRSTRHCAS